MHRHPAYHLILVSQGSCELLVSERLPVHCPLNSLIIIQPDFPHDFRTDDNGVEHSCIIFTLENSRGEACTIPFDRFFAPQAAVHPYRVIPLSDSSSAVPLPFAAARAGRYAIRKNPTPTAAAFSARERVSSSTSALPR